MKTHLKFIPTIITLWFGLLAAGAAEPKVEAGPNGGRLLEKTQPKAEFLVEKDRTVSIRFYDAGLKPVAVTGQSGAVIAMADGRRTRLDFKPQDGRLVSTSKLPDGDGYGLVVQLKARADAKPQNFRFTLDLHTCGGCQRAEYACTCGH
jgi:hypothetical protein